MSIRQIALDTETTGLSTAEGHRIIEIGAVELVHRRITKNRFHTYLNPNRPVDPGAIEVHGLTDAFLSDKPHFHDIASSLLSFLQGAELIIHNAAFDIGFLNYEFSFLPEKYGALEEYCTVLDTLALARAKHPNQRNSLDALCKRYGINNKHRERHGALLDAELLASVYLAMTTGQASLLDILSSEDSDEPTVETPTELNPELASVNYNGDYNIHIVHAAPSDEAKHNEYLKKMSQKAPNIFWSIDSGI